MVDTRTGGRIAQLIRRLDPQAKLLRTWALQGGVSAQMTAFEIALPGGRTRTLIVRQHGEVERRGNPRIAADEFRLLQALQTVRLAVPAPLYLDTSREILPAPYLVLEYVEGAPEFAPPDLDDLVRQLASYLAQVHRVDLSNPALPFLRRHGKGYGPRPGELDVSLQEGRIRDALEAAWPLAHLNEPALLHGDFWPGNVLWKDGRLVAVVDWEDARVGDPLADVGNARLELLWAFGREAVQRFMEAYQSRMPNLDLADLPFWDLCAALRPAGKLAGWGLDPATENAMRERHRWFVDQALGRLANSSTIQGSAGDPPSPGR
jgi:aminoglycoside phosphotransferase (APT) family kinase protein